MLKILHILDEPWDSAITHYALQVSELFQKQGHQVVLALLKGKKPEKRALEKGLSVLPFVSLLELKSILSSKPWDVVNVHTGRTHTWTVLFSLLMKKKVSWAIVRTRGDARALSTHPLIKFIYRKTQGVIAASQHVGEQYEQGLPLNSEQLSVIYPSVQIDEKIQPYEPFTVGVLGRLDPVKGHAYFIEAASLVLKKIPQVQFLIAGKEANISQSMLFNQVKVLGIEESVKFLGYVENTADFMRRCHVGVISSIGSEEISRACLEWMGLGRPLVGTLVGCLSELIEPGENGFLVSPSDSTAMAVDIIKILENKALSDSLGHQSWLLAQRKFSPQIQYEKTLGAYQQAMRNLNQPLNSRHIPG
ncbi:MAG: glycosyltransferase family 4 protein [Elusimicrobiota bacterium]